MKTQEDLEQMGEMEQRDYFRSLSKSEFIRYFVTGINERYHLKGDIYILMREEYMIKKFKTKGYF